ncbi:MAG: hypothetical protein IPJ74_25755 [Saprospiraceae bacterium]|nr:hypothetical protein [Saprospiraceae bacterium]
MKNRHPTGSAESRANDMEQPGTNKIKDIVRQAFVSERPLQSDFARPVT